jgi:hypothetical protein
MQIDCTTARAAAEVLAILLSARLRPGREFYVTGPIPPGTPVHITLNAPLPAHLVAQVQAIPDTTIKVSMHLPSIADGDELEISTG